MIYGETHEQQMVSRLIPKREFVSESIELHDGRRLSNQHYWRVQIGRYPFSAGPHSEFNEPVPNMLLNGSRYVVWGFFETEEEAIQHASDTVREKPWFYGPKNEASETVLPPISIEIPMPLTKPPAQSRPVVAGNTG